MSKPRRGPSWRGVFVAVMGAALAGPAGLGCGRGARTVPVQGTVTLDGVPMAGVAVSFTPIGAEGAVGPGSSGVTDEHGRFSLKTVDDRRRTGAVVGKHRVTLFEPRSGADDPYADPTLTPAQLAAKLEQIRFKLPPEARDGSLTFEVPPNGTTEANFAFRSAFQPQR